MLATKLTLPSSQFRTLVKVQQENGDQLVQGKIYLVGNEVVD